MFYTITGNNAYKINEYLREKVDAFTKLYGELAIEKIDASEQEADDIVQAMRNLPFLAKKKMIIVRNASKNQTMLEDVESLRNEVPEQNDVFLVDQLFDKRKKYYKQLQNSTEFTEFKTDTEQSLVAWVIAEVSERGGTIARSHAQLLISRVGDDQMRLQHELEKLLLYKSNINETTIQFLSDETLQSSIFSLLDAAFSGKQKVALEIFHEQRLARVEPSYIIAMLTWQLQAIALAVYADPKTESTLIKAGQSPYTAKKALRLARTIDRSSLKRLVSELSQLDVNIKSGTVDADAALELYLLQIAD